MAVVELPVSWNEKMLTSMIGFSFDIVTKPNVATEARVREAVMAMMGIERVAIMLALALSEGTIVIIERESTFCFFLL